MWERITIMKDTMKTQYQRKKSQLLGYTGLEFITLMTIQLSYQEYQDLVFH